MARKKSLVIEIIGNNKMGRAVRDAMASMRRLGGMARSVGRGIGRAFRGAVIGVAALTAAIAGLVKVYAVQQQADSDLAAAVAGSELAVDHYVAKLKEEAAQIQKNTKYGDEFIQELQAQAINMGVLVDGATDATKAALGLAKAYGLEVKSALRLVTRARVGDTASLKRYGIILDDTLSSEEKYQAILKIGAANYGLVEAEVDTLGGRFQQLKNNIGDAMEQLGGAVAEGLDLEAVFVKLSDKTAGLGDGLKEKLIPRLKEFKEILDGLVSGGEDRAKAIQTIKDNWNTALAFVKPKLEEWGSTVGRSMWEGFKSAAGGAANRAAVAQEQKTSGSLFRKFTAVPSAGSAFLGGFAGSNEGLMSKFRAGAGAAGTDIRRTFLGPGSSPSNPVYSKEVDPNAGVE